MNTYHVCDVYQWGLINQGEKRRVRDAPRIPTLLSLKQKQVQHLFRATWSHRWNNKRYLAIVDGTFSEDASIGEHLHRRWTHHPKTVRMKF